MARLAVRVRPGARRTAVVRYDGAVLHLDIAAPPIEGRANAALIDFVADELGLPERALEVIRGHRTRNKLLEVDVPAARLEEWLRGQPR